MFDIDKDVVYNTLLKINETDSLAYQNLEWDIIVEELKLYGMVMINRDIDSLSNGNHYIKLTPCGYAHLQELKASISLYKESDISVDENSDNIVISISEEIVDDSLAPADPIVIHTDEIVDDEDKSKSSDDGSIDTVIDIEEINTEKKHPGRKKKVLE